MNQIPSNLEIYTHPGDYTLVGCERRKEDSIHRTLKRHEDVLRRIIEKHQRSSINNRNLSDGD